jgi:hypothetical protein
LLRSFVTITRYPQYNNKKIEKRWRKLSGPVLKDIRNSLGVGWGWEGRWQVRLGGPGPRLPPIGDTRYLWGRQGGLGAAFSVSVTFLFLKNKERKES